MSKANHGVTVVVDRLSDEPVYEQIAGQIRLGIANARLPEGTVLPPVRVLASDLGVNLNTVARAYRLLEEEGFVRIEDRAGATVAPPAGRIDLKAKQRLCSELRLLLARMRQAGVTREELRRIMQREVDALRDDTPAAR